MFKSKFAEAVFLQKYSRNGQESWEDCVDRVVTAAGYSYIKPYMLNKEFIPGGRYLYASGAPLHPIKNCFSLRAVDSREGWAKLLYDVSMTLMLGGGIGIDYSNIRAKGSIINSTGGEASGVLSLMIMIDAVAQQIQSGGSRRAALWAGLNWSHKEAIDFFTCKVRDALMLKMKAKDFNYRMPLEMTNISIQYDDKFLENPDMEFWYNHMLAACKHGDPGWSFDFGSNSLLTLRNACSEFISDTNMDSCNLGTIFINKIQDKDHMAKVVKHAVKFLLRGQLYSDLPTEEAKKVTRENNRIGLGLAGVGEWLLERNLPFEENEELKELLEVYAEVAESEAKAYSKKLGLNTPKATRAIAPAGSLSILAESTSGMEPLFCKSYIRSRWVGDKYMSTYVVDETVKRLIDKGIKSEDIYDSFDISFESRVKFQAFLQEYVDMGISSTCNLPAWGTELNNENNVKEKADILLKYATKLRGFTVYADGAINGQPLQRCSLEEALNNEGTEFEADTVGGCRSGVCGI